MTLAALAPIGVLGATAGLATAATTAAAAKGLAPQFAAWKVPVYTSHVTGTTTYAPTSYGITTTDTEDQVIAWYRSKLKDRVADNGFSHSPVKQLAVDSGAYVINLEKGKGVTEINVIKN